MKGKAQGNLEDQGPGTLLLKKQILLKRLNLLEMQVVLITPIPIHPSFLMQELTGTLIQVPLAT